MPKIWVILVLVIFIVACGNKKKSLAGEDEVSAEDFFGAFSDIKLPFAAADTNIRKIADTTVISLHTVEQFVPDSALKHITKNAKNVKFYPVGKIEKNGDIYLLMDIVNGKATSLATFLFNKQNKYIDALSLISNNSDDNYRHSLNINSEPTFMINKEKTENDQYLYTKNGYGYSKEAKDFIIVINDSNEGVERNAIINPIDTLPKANKFSGDYVKDKKNFISVRDGRNGANYIFFTHFEKNDGDCTGELKGSFAMVDATKAVYRENAGPCVIDFSFEGNSVNVKERGNCGNHRGIRCEFNDTYRKKKATKPKAKTSKSK